MVHSEKGESREPVHVSRYITSFLRVWFQGCSVAVWAGPRKPLGPGGADAFLAGLTTTSRADVAVRPSNGGVLGLYMTTVCVVQRRHSNLEALSDETSIPNSN